MTPGARVQAAIELLDHWLEGVAIEKALTGWARGARYAGSKDRAAVRDHVYAALRSRGRAAALGRGDDGRALMIGSLRLSGLDPAALFTGIGHAPALLNADECVAPSATPDLRQDVPAWILPRLEVDLGSDLEPVLRAFAERAPAYVRVNTRKATLASARARLNDDGIVSVPDQRASTALRMEDGARKLLQSKAFQSGLVELQDLSVQRAVLACPWPASGRVLDYCAGGGGKSLAIAPLTEARLFVHDAYPRRMSDLPARASRAGVAVTMLQSEDLTRFAPYEAVLCDVPCAGSGTWRRDPEAKWRLTREGLDALTKTQASILHDASRLVRPGGAMIYMTCSLFDAENGGQVRAFLADHSGWILEQEAQETPLTASDGFYHCVLRYEK